MSGPVGEALTGCSVFLVPCVLSFLLTLLFLYAAPRLGLMDQPNDRKVHMRPTPKGGGLAIYSSLLLTVGLYSLFEFPFPLLLSPFPILGFGSALVVIGQIDDLRPLSWRLRLIVHGAVAAVTLIHWPLDLSLANRLLMGFWIVALINAFNMLDNMDALSGGVAWIAAAVLALATLLRHGSAEWAQAAPLLMLMGALSGFLWFNRPPARIFMGDAGSTFLGYFLAVSSLRGSLGEVGHWQTWAAALCVLAVPWYDMVSVVTIRLRQGRSPFHADKQHLSHRLVERGLHSVWAVRVIHLLALASGLAGLAVAHATPIGALLLGLGMVFAWAGLAAGEYTCRRQR